MLETPRVILRFHTLKDGPDFLDLNSDPEVIRYTGATPPRNLLDAEAIIKNRLFPQHEIFKMGRFAVTLKNGTYIGWCGLRHFDEKNEVDLGYRFKKNYWNQAMATEASLASLQYGFETLHLEKIIATAMPENIASIKVMQKLGMTFKGVVREKDDPLPLVRYEISAEEFKACRK